MDQRDGNIWGDLVEDTNDQTGINLRVYYSSKFHQFLVELKKEEIFRTAILDAMYEPKAGINPNDWTNIALEAETLAKEIDSEIEYKANNFVSYLERYGEPTSQTVDREYIISLWLLEDENKYLVHILGEDRVFIKEVSLGVNDPIQLVSEYVEHGIRVLNEEAKDKVGRKKTVLKLG